MTATIARRAFIAAIGGAAAWPLVAGAQQPALPVIGLLQLGAPSSWDFTGFRQGLKDTGYVEGQNLAIPEVRWANNDPDRLPELAADLARRQVHDEKSCCSFGSQSSAGKLTSTCQPVSPGSSGSGKRT